MILISPLKFISFSKYFENHSFIFDLIFILLSFFQYSWNLTANANVEMKILIQERVLFMFMIILRLLYNYIYLYCVYTWNIEIWDLMCIFVIDSSKNIIKIDEKTRWIENLVLAAYGKNDDMFIIKINIEQQYQNLLKIILR
jgi:hypothetical protein